MIEVVKEEMSVKQATFAKVEQHMKPGSIISSNTSGLSIKGMTEGRSAAFKKNFLVTHDWTVLVDDAAAPPRRLSFDPTELAPTEPSS